MNSTNSTVKNTERNSETYNLVGELSSCTLCPRNCMVNRLSSSVLEENEHVLIDNTNVSYANSSRSFGYCGQGSSLRAARAALHYWEEPVLSGINGSGAVFFSGCNLRCVFCQNHSIAIGKCGREITIDRLSEIFLELQEKGAHNINLVTGTPYIPHIAKALNIAKNKGLTIPIVYNSSGYENVSSLKMLDGLIDIYLPDLKYYSTEYSTRYSNAPDYFEKATLAIAEMYNQVGMYKIDNETKSSFNKGEDLMLMKRGMIVRHLVLPGLSKDTKKVLRYLYETYGDNIYISIMSQYTPLPGIEKFPELNRKVTPGEYEKIVSFAIKLGIENAFIQGDDVASESFIPNFDYEGL